MSKRRLILFCSVYPSKRGEQFLHNEIPHINTEFEEVVVFTESDEKAIGRESINIYNYQRKYDYRLKLSFILLLFKEIFSRKLYSLSKIKVAIGSLLVGNNIRRIVKSNINSGKISKRDIYYTYWMSDSTLGLSLLKLEFPELKFVSRVHRWDLYEEENIPHYLPFRPFILNQITKVVSISEDGISYLTSRYGHQNKIVLSRLGVDRFNVDPKKKLADIPVIVSCSNIIPVKRVDLILEAIKEIKDFQLKWIHFGGGKDFNSLSNKVESLRITHPSLKVALKGGTPNQEILKYYAENQVDLFVNVSSSEGVPVSIMEAMQAGIPVIATKVGGSSEAVVDRQNGFLMDKNVSAKDLGEKIMELLTSPSLKSKFSEGSIRLYEERFDAIHNYQGFCKLLKEV